jgi:uncharacterized membrane protein
MSKSRLEAFSDGVMAVAITLLVLDLHVDPGSKTSLAAQLAQSWPSFAAYGVSFLVIGVIWVNHHAVLNLVGTVDRVLLFFNLLLLAFVTSVPFATSTLAGYLADGRSADVRVAVLVYGVSMTGMAVSYTLLFARASSSLSTPGHRWPPSRRSGLIRFGIGTVLYPAVALIGLVDAPLMLVVYGALSLYYMFDQTRSRGSDLA